MKTTIYAFLISVFSFSGVALADTSSPWQAGFGYQTRLIQGERTEDGTFKLGLQIALEEGWKTYWRMPGDNGIPPDLNFSASSNVRAYKIYWPKPAVFQDGDGLSVGYKQTIILPISVQPEHSDKPIDLSISAFFGVCSEVCVPAQADLSVQLDPGESVSDFQFLIEEALAEVPKSQTGQGLRVHSAHLTAGDKETIEVAVELPGETEQLVILAEGPQHWYVEPLREYFPVVTGEPLTFSVPLHRTQKDGESDPLPLRLTVIADDEAVQTDLLLARNE